MPYININEYDYTITGPKTYSENIAVVPINATDGPSDKWVSCNTYETFIQTFGPNPNPNSLFGNSWEYAANLLLRGMPVCVRRITNYLQENGENRVGDLLPDVTIAKTIVKVNDVIGSTDDANVQLSKGVITLIDDNLNSCLKSSNEGVIATNPKYKFWVDTDTTDGIVDNSGIHPNGFTLNNHLLQMYDNKEPIVFSFANVGSTNTEWAIYSKKTPNERCKNFIYDENGNSTYVDMSIDSLFEMTDHSKYNDGDFFIEHDAGHVVRYVGDGVNNPLCITTNGDINYPYELKNTNIYDNNDISDGSFLSVKYSYNEDDHKYEEKNCIWKYSKTCQTFVLNHLFVEHGATNTIQIDEENEIGAYNDKDKLPTTNVKTNNFALVGTDMNAVVYVYDDEKSWTQQINNITLDDIINSETDYTLFASIPFEQVKKTDGTPLSKNDVDILNTCYASIVYWESTGESYTDYNNANNNPSFLYTPYIMCEDTGIASGTTNTTILENSTIEINNVVVETKYTTSDTCLSLSVNDKRDIKIENDTSDTKLSTGYFSISNISDKPIRLYKFKIYAANSDGSYNKIPLFNIGLDSTIVNGINTSNLGYYDLDNNVPIVMPEVQIYSNIAINRYYIELQPKTKLVYMSSISTGKMEFSVSGFGDFNIEANAFVHVSNGSKYSIALSSKKNTPAVISKYYIPKTIEDENIDYSNIPAKDMFDNFNLFVAKYKYPGTNGNHLNVRIKTIRNQGIYLYVYRNQQYLERIELCSFRWADEKGKIKILNIESYAPDIWKIILNKFGILEDRTGNLYDSYGIPLDIDHMSIPTLSATYVNIELNKNILKENNTYAISYVKSLYSQTGDQIAYLKEGKNPDDEHVIHEIYKAYQPLKDKYRYDIKFITNGGYVDELIYSDDLTNPLATSDVARYIEDAMIDLATSRKDTVAFLDIPYDLDIEDVPNYFEHISTSYAAAYAPWARMSLGTGSIKWMPPSFVQLYTHAKSIQNGNKLYLPPAGVRRALVPEIVDVKNELSSDYITLWQDNNTPQFINPVIWINGYDYTIYGQKTLYNIVDSSRKNESALQDLNVRLVANEIKKLIFKTCIDLTFELNNIMTWNEFKSKITPTLSQMQGEGILTSYNVLMGTETMTAADLNSGHIVGTVKVSIARAATDWDINFELTPNNVTFNEYDYNSTYSE